MPITVTAPHGALTPAGERDILPQLTAALIDASGQSGNRFFTPLVGGTVQFLPPEQIYAALKKPHTSWSSTKSRLQEIGCTSRRANEIRYKIIAPCWS